MSRYVTHNASALGHVLEYLKLRAAHEPPVYIRAFEQLSEEMFRHDISAEFDDDAATLVEDLLLELGCLDVDPPEHPYNGQS